MTESSAYTQRKLHFPLFSFSCSFSLMVLFSDLFTLLQCKHNCSISAPQTVDKLQRLPQTSFYVSVNCLWRNPEMGQRIFRDKMVLGEWRGEDQLEFKGLFVFNKICYSSWAKGIMLLDLYFCHHTVWMLSFTSLIRSKGQSTVKWKRFLL